MFLTRSWLEIFPGLRDMSDWNGKDGVPAIGRYCHGAAHRIRGEMLPLVQAGKMHPLACVAMNDPDLARHRSKLVVIQNEVIER
jgi:hypothetical protein